MKSVDHKYVHKESSKSWHLCSRNCNVNQISLSHRRSILVRKLCYRGRAKVTLVLYLTNYKGHRYILFNIELAKYI